MHYSYIAIKLRIKMRCRLIIYKALFTYAACIVAEQIDKLSVKECKRFMIPYLSSQKICINLQYTLHE